MHPDPVTGVSLFRVLYYPNVPTKKWHAGYAIRINFKIKISRIRSNPDLVTSTSLFRVLSQVQYHPNFPTKKWRAGHANSNASGSCDGYVTCSCAVKWTFLHLRASKIWILWGVCRFFGRNTNSSEIECIRILWPRVAFSGALKSSFVECICIIVLLLW